jgi:hypothetical protein
MTSDGYTEMYKFLDACIAGEKDALATMIAPNYYKAAEDQSGDAFEVMETRARLKTYLKVRARLDSVRRDYPPKGV